MKQWTHIVSLNTHNMEIYNNYINGYKIRKIKDSLYVVDNYGLCIERIDTLSDILSYLNTGKWFSNISILKGCKELNRLSLTYVWKRVNDKVLNVIYDRNLKVLTIKRVENIDNYIAQCCLLCSNFEVLFSNIEFTGLVRGTSLEIISTFNYIINDRYTINSIFQDLVVEVINLPDLDLSNCNTLSCMFRGYKGKRINFGKFDTSNVRDFSLMFCDCENLVGLDMSQFCLNSAEKLNSMFNGCSSFKELDLSNFNITENMNVETMFCDCSKLECLKIGTWRINKLGLSSMFKNCDSLNFDFYNKIIPKNTQNDIDFENKLNEMNKKLEKLEVQIKKSKKILK